MLAQNPQSRELIRGDVELNDPPAKSLIETVPGAPEERRKPAAFRRIDRQLATFRIFVHCHASNFAGCQNHTCKYYLVQSDSVRPGSLQLHGHMKISTS